MLQHILNKVIVNISEFALYLNELIKICLEDYTAHIKISLHIGINDGDDYVEDDHNKDRYEK